MWRAAGAWMRCRKRIVIAGHEPGGRFTAAAADGSVSAGCTSFTSSVDRRRWDNASFAAGELCD
jgi:hypothetical protein